MKKVWLSGIEISALRKTKIKPFNKALNKILDGWDKWFETTLTLKWSGSWRINSLFIRENPRAQLALLDEDTQARRDFLFKNWAMPYEHYLEAIIDEDITIE